MSIETTKNQLADNYSSLLARLSVIVEMDHCIIVSLGKSKNVYCSNTTSYQNVCYKPQKVNKQV